MKNQENSEGGMMDDDIYATWETKVCPQCKLCVRECYTAEILVRGKVELKEIKIS
jgi:ferredoxin